MLDNVFSIIDMPNKISKQCKKKLFLYWNMNKYLKICTYCWGERGLQNASRTVVWLKKGVGNLSKSCIGWVYNKCLKKHEKQTFMQRNVKWTVSLF